MGKRLFVGNLPYDVTEAQIKEPFAAIGKVLSVRMIMDRDSGRFKGFAFVEMSTDAEAANAIAQLHNKDIAGRRIIVSEARPIGEKPAGAHPSSPGSGNVSSKPADPSGAAGFSPSTGWATLMEPQMGGGRGFGGGGRRRVKPEWERRRDERERESLEQRRREKNRKPSRFEIEEDDFEDEDF